jgi:hypothetical protein
MDKDHGSDGKVWTIETLYRRVDQTSPARQGSRAPIRKTDSPVLGVWLAALGFAVRSRTFGRDCTRTVWARRPCCAVNPDSSSRLVAPTIPSRGVRTS